MRLLVFLYCLWGSFLAYSQIGQYKVYNLTSEDGLLSDNVECLFQDSYGFLWIGSNDGVVRWDGYNFKKYIHQEGDVNTLSNNIIYTIVEDSRRRLWVGTINGINLYDPLSDTFSKIKLDAASGNIPVNAIKEDSKHRLWLATSDGFCQYNHDYPQKSKWYYAETPNGLSDAVVFAMDIDRNDNLWLGTFNGGLNKFNTETCTFSYFTHRPDDPSTICSNKLKRLFIDKDQNIWVGSIDNGLSVINQKGEVFRQYKSFETARGIKERLNNITCIYQDETGMIWVGAGDQKLCYLNTSKNALVPFMNPVHNQYHITCQGITSLFEDFFGNTWFGSERDGLFYTNKTKNMFRHYYHNYSNAAGLSHNKVTAFCQDKNNGTWIGTNGGGLDYLDHTNNSIQSFSKKTGIQSQVIQDIVSEASGKLWIATHNGGVTMFDPNNRKSETFQHDPLRKNSLVFNDITSLVIDDSLVWMGTYGEGVCIYNTLRKQFYHHQNNTVFPFNMRAPGWTNHLYKDSKKRIWMGSYGGLHRYDNHTFRTFTHSADPTSISNHDINMIAEDARGNIWIITVAGGLELFDENTNTFIHYSKLFDLPLTLKSIVVDNKGLLWMGSNSGLICFDPVSKKQMRYGSSDGLQGDFFNVRAASKNKSGELFFGGSNGFNAFHPEKIRHDFKPSGFYFTALSVFGVAQKPTASQSVLSKNIQVTDTLSLSYNQSFFTIEFTDINFYSPGKTLYAYKLEGLYDRWINNQSERKISFTNLPAGRYTLKVKYTLPNGRWQLADKTLIILVAPPWWNSWWFISLAVASTCIALFLLYKQRVRNIKKRNEVLETEVRSRTMELSDRNSDLQESNEEIKQQKEKLEAYNLEVVRQSDKILAQQEFILRQNQELEKLVGRLFISDETKNLFFNILAHDLRGPISGISNLSDLLINNISNLSSQEIIDFSQHIKQSSDATQKLLSNLLDWARSQSQYLDYLPVALNSYDLIVRNLILMEQQCLQKDIQVINLVGKEHSIFADYNMIDTVVRNLISNAVKFTPPAGTITITSSLHHEEVEIRVSDTGLGISDQELKNIFQLGKRKSTKGTKGETGTGLGLIIVKEFTAINKGSVAIESKEKEGTTFTLRLPMALEVVPAESNFQAEAIVQENKGMSLLSEDQLTTIKGNKILLVEDNLSMRNHLKYLLASTFEITEAENGREALLLAAEIQPMVVITDMVMPVMDGLEFCKALKKDQNTSHIPVIILTSHDNEEGKLSGYYAGADIYLTKPVQKEILLQIIFNILQSRKHLLNNILTRESESLEEEHTLTLIDQKFLEKISSFIEENIANQELEVHHIVRHMAMSRSVLYSKFKAITGQGVNEFIRLLRLRKSKERLITSSMSINEIADAVGFNSASYFIRCFVKEYQITPTEFRGGKKQ
ncbi:MAG: response regulator [Cytophagaceae bacterium]|nr:response regulator [Cytophagaceae bacterium]